MRTGLLVSTVTVTHSPSRGDAQHYTVKAGDRTAEDAALRYADSPIAELRDLIRLEWDAMDGWFEEDEEVYTHPRDPYTRVDILASSRQVRVEGVVLASSTNPRVLFETGLPPRWKIAGLVAFYNEEVDLFVDNQPQQRPVTKFSRKERTTMPNESAHQTRLERILGVRWRRTPCASGPRVASCWRGGRASARWSTDYGDGRVYRNISIAELHDGKAVRVTDYWGEPFTPPAWREALATRLDMPRDGVWPAADVLQGD